MEIKLTRFFDLSSNKAAVVKMPLAVAAGGGSFFGPAGKRPSNLPPINDRGAEKRVHIVNRDSPAKENVVSPSDSAARQHPQRPVAMGGRFQREGSVDNGGIFSPTSGADRSGFQRRSSLNSPADNLEGPYNFRQLLRKTEYAPTPTLRKMKDNNSLHNQTP